MSLPQAKQSVSEHPAKDSVTVPANRLDRDRDVGRKIKLYGALEAFRRGRMPTNKQLDDGLLYARKHSPVEVEELSGDGKRVAEDARGMIDTFRMILDEKNADELLQNFIWNTRDIDREILTNTDTTSLPVDRDTARSHAQQAVQHLRTLFHLVLTNSEARKLLSDFSVIGRDLLAKSAVKAAETIAPSEEALHNVDESAPQNQFITQGGRRVGPDETPVLEARLPGTDTTMRRHPREDETMVHPPDGPARPVTDVAEDAKSHAKDLAEEGRRTGEDAKRAGVDVARQPEGARENEAHAKKTGFMAKIKALPDRIPSQHKEKARGGVDRGKEQIDRGKRFLTEEYFHEERRNQFIYRGKKVIIECQKHNDYQDSIRWLLDYIEQYAKHGRTLAGQHGTQAQGVFSDPKVDLAVRQLRTLLERFANNTSLVDVINAVNVLIEDSRRDPELRSWFSDVDAYIRRLLLESGFVLEPLSTARGRELRDSGRRFYDEKYRGQFDDLFSAVSDWFGAMAQDPLNKRFGEDWTRLAKDLFFTPSGTLTFKSDLWSDLRRTVLPDVTRKLGYIPIPRIEYTDPDIDLVIENLALQGRNILPNIVSLEANNYVKFSPYNAIQDEGKHEVHLQLEQMQADMRDVAFYYRVKTGLAKVKDSGLADVLIGGKGIVATVVLHSPPSPAVEHRAGSLFEVKSVRTKVHSLKFSVRNSKHDFLYRTIKPLAVGLIKRQIQKAISDLLMTGMDYLDGQLVSIKEKMENKKAEEGEDETRTQALKSSVQKKKESTVRRENEATADEQKKKTRHFKIVSNKRDSLLAGAGHPAGWVKLTEERDQAAVSGEEWRSEAFDIKPKGGTQRGQATDRAGGSSAASGTTGTAQAPPPVSIPAPSPLRANGHQGVDTAPPSGYAEPSTGLENTQGRLAAGGSAPGNAQRVTSVVH